MQALAAGAKSFAELRLALEIMFEGVEGAGMLPVAGVDEVRRRALGEGADQVSASFSADRCSSARYLINTASPRLLTLLTRRGRPCPPILCSPLPLPPKQTGLASFSPAHQHHPLASLPGDRCSGAGLILPRSSVAS